MRKVKRLAEEAPEISPLSLDAVNRILDTVHPWYRPYLTIAFFTGMRAGEQNGLSWSDFLVDMKPEHVILRAKGNGELLRDRNGQPAYALIDYELLQRTPEHEESVRSQTRKFYLSHMAHRFEGRPGRFRFEGDQLTL